MTLWSYTVTYLPSTDITAYVTEISDVTIPTNEVRSAEFTLRAKDGAFRTIDNSGATPKLTKYDKIKIQFTDRDNNSETHIFEVDTLRPIKDTSGNKLVVGCLGQEHHLQNIHYSKSKQRESAFNMIKDIVDVYNSNKGSAQVTIEKHTIDSEVVNGVTYEYNKAPIWTANDYDFSNNPTCFEALQSVLDRMGSSVANGGAGDFYEMVFVEGSDSAKINIKVFVSGESGTTTIENSLTTPITLTNGTEENETGTVVVGMGASGFGSLPKDFSRHWSSLEAFYLHPQFDSNFSYKTGVSVQHNGVHYKSNADNNTQTPGTGGNWSVIKAADEIGLVPPSPWTYKKAALWKNSGSNSASTGVPNTSNLLSIDTNWDQKGCYDGNLVIMDEDHYRNWVNIKSNTSVYSTSHKYGGAATGAYRGFRILVTGTPAGAFAQNSGNDRNGKAYLNAFVKHNGGSYSDNEEYKNWDVIRTASNNDVCAVIDEGKNYLYSSSSSSWSDDSANYLANDCFHVYDSLTNDVGVSETYKQKGDNSWLDLDSVGGADTGETYGNDSAIKVEYTFTTIKEFATLWETAAEHGQIGCWLNLMFPFPANTNNAIDESVGELYGGSSTTKEPATLDASGIFGYTPKGHTGWNKEDSEEQGVLESIDFNCKFRVDDTLFNLTYEIGGKFKWRCIMYDISNNVVFQDFEILDNDRWEQQSLPLTGFSPYRARVPLKWGDETATNLIVPELEVLERFEYKNIKMIVFQLQEVYDDHGRFNPLFGRFGVLLAGSISGARTTFWIDALRFSKQLVVVTSPNTTRNIESDFVHRPDTTNYQQLKQDMEAQKEIEQHQYRAFEIEMGGRNDILPGDSFYLKDEKMIDDNDGAANKIKLVNKEVHYSVNGSDGGTGGYVRKILGVKRI